MTTKTSFVILRNNAHLCLLAGKWRSRYIIFFHQKMRIILGVSYQNSYGKALKNEWVQVDPPCAQTRVKSSLGTYVLNK